MAPEFPFHVAVKARVILEPMVFKNNESMFTRLNESEISGEVAKTPTIVTTSKEGVAIIPPGIQVLIRGGLPRACNRHPTPTRL